MAGTAAKTLTPRPDRLHELNESVIPTLNPSPSYNLGSPTTARVLILNEGPMRTLR